MHSARVVTVRWAAPWLLVLMLASQVSAQGPAAVTTPPAGRIIERLAVSDDVRATWARVVACAGAARDTTQTFDQIVFLLRSPGRSTPGGRPVKGEWVAPDTVLITQGWEHSGWVVAHELLHHAINGPPDRTNTHPPEVFMRCGLWYDPTGDGTPGASAAGALVGGPDFAYPVLGYAIYIQGTLLAGNGWWRA